MKPATSHPACGNCGKSFQGQRSDVKTILGGGIHFDGVASMLTCLTSSHAIFCGKDICFVCRYNVSSRPLINAKINQFYFVLIRAVDILV